MKELNSTQAMVLGILGDGRMTGSEIHKAAEERLSGLWTVNRSQVYRELTEMTHLGLVRASTPGFRNSVIFTVTKRGTRSFTEWLSQTPKEDTVRSPMALRVLFANYQSPDNLDKTIDEAIKFHEEQERLIMIRIADAREAGNTPHAAALGFAISYHRCTLAWLDSLEVSTIQA